MAAPRRLTGLLDVDVAGRWRQRLEARPEGSLRLFEALAAADVQAVLAPALRPLLDDRTLLVASQCWLRRARPAHHWHQDGALHHDFVARPQGEPLAMTTCWIALTPCGREAPGFEWIAAPVSALLHPGELVDAALRRRWPAAAFEHAELEAGDALLFDGALLHRTQVGAALTRPRASIELRFVAAPAPARLTGETLRSWA